MTLELKFHSVEPQPIKQDPVEATPVQPAISDEQRAYDICKSWSPERREKEKKHLEQLLAVQAGLVPERIDPLTKQAIPHLKSQWMVPTWEFGLRILNQVINETKIVDNANPTV